MFLIKGKKGAEEMLIVMIMLFVLTLMFLGIFYYLWNYDVDDGNSFILQEKVILQRVITGDTILLNNGDYVLGLLF